MNNNFKKIVENNIDFINYIKNILEESFLEEEPMVESLKKIKKNKMFKKIKKYLKEVFISDSRGILNTEKNCIVLEDNKNLIWYFSINNFDLIQIQKHLENEDFYITHNINKSYVKENEWSRTKHFVEINFINEQIPKEEVELLKILYDKDISFLLDTKIEDFKFNKESNSRSKKVKKDE